MKLLIFLIAFILSKNTNAQNDTIFIKGGQQILCNTIKEKKEQYQFTFLDVDNTKQKSTILKYLVDSIRYFTCAIDNVNASITKTDAVALAQIVEPTKKEKPWKSTIAVGVNLGSILEFNNTTGTDKKTLSLDASLDLGLNYKKEGHRFEMTNELHYLFGIQKEGLSTGAHIQRVQDQLTTLHDISLGFGKKSKWNFNVIVRSVTSLLPVFDGGYFKNFTTLGRTQGFASPYDVTVSPGIKYEPNTHFRISLSPYSFQLYGVKNNEIRNKGIFITDVNPNGNYKNFLFKRLGAEVNFWYDNKIKEWLDMQYRLSFSSNYFESFGKNGLMDGLFITRIRIIKDIYFTHRLTLKSDFAVNFLKPYFNQVVQLSYAKSF